ncbi:hypothetical protein [Amycolatopsis sp.]|uniref:hypothetical protein n=1 Tax=Amycolatopsis sp. TaxID=37632 RepID=UPI00260809C3|nr:hypothetical protein [Amycolatopsis sp.]
MGFIRIRRGCAGAAVDRVLSLLLGLKIADVDARLSAGLLAPSARDVLVERVETLQVTRAGALDSHGAELRRIERDDRAPGRPALDVPADPGRSRAVRGAGGGGRALFGARRTDRR